MGQDEADKAWQLGPGEKEAELTSVRTRDERGRGFRLVDRAYISGHGSVCHETVENRHVGVMAGLEGEDWPQALENEW